MQFKIILLTKNIYRNKPQPNLEIIKSVFFLFTVDVISVEINLLSHFPFHVTFSILYLGRSLTSTYILPSLACNFSFSFCDASSIFMMVSLSRLNMLGIKVTLVRDSGNMPILDAYASFIYILGIFTINCSPTLSLYNSRFG